MNPSTAFSQVLVDELCRGGVREAVLCPGARNTPLSFALHAADREGRLRLHVRIDERTAGYLALGLARASGIPVPVAVTSGTAVANLHPAVLEASHTSTPLVLLTADRPIAARGLGSNQSIDQVKLYGDAVRLFADVETPVNTVGSNAYWRGLACRTLAFARGAVSDDPGPVHVNVPLREPLTPDADPSWPESLDGAPEGRPWISVVPPPTPSLSPYDGPDRTLVVVGDCPPDIARAAADLAGARGWPLLAEPLSAARADALDGGMLALGDAGFLQRHRPERILMVGRPTLSRAVTTALRSGAPVDVVPHSPRWADPGSVGAYLQAPGSVPARVLPRSSLGVAPGERSPYADQWGVAAAAALSAARESLAAAPGPTGLHMAAEMTSALPAEASLLFLGSSSAVRDVDLVGALAGRPIRLMSNRGAAGIDGNVSTAIGAALTMAGPSYALMGDLTFLYDAMALMLGPAEPRPDLTIVVANDDGGGVFSLLEAGGSEHADAFQRILGTPTGVDLGALCAATATPHVRVERLADLPAAFAPAAGIRVVEVPTSRTALREVHKAVREAVREAVNAG